MSFNRKRRASSLSAVDSHSASKITKGELLAQKKEELSAKVNGEIQFEISLADVEEAEQKFNFAPANEQINMGNLILYRGEAVYSKKIIVGQIQWYLSARKKGPILLINLGVDADSGFASKLLGSTCSFGYALSIVNVNAQKTFSNEWNGQKKLLTIEIGKRYGEILDEADEDNFVKLSYASAHLSWPEAIELSSNGKLLLKASLQLREQNFGDLYFPDSIYINGKRLDINLHAMASISTFFRKYFNEIAASSEFEVTFYLPKGVDCCNFGDLLSLAFPEHQRRKEWQCRNRDLTDGHVHNMLKLASEQYFGIPNVTKICEQFLMEKSKNYSGLAKYYLAEEYKLCNLKNYIFGLAHIYWRNNFFDAKFFLCNAVHWSKLNATQQREFFNKLDSNQSIRTEVSSLDKLGLAIQCEQHDLKASILQNLSWENFNGIEKFFANIDHWSRLDEETQLEVLVQISEQQNRGFECACGGNICYPLMDKWSREMYK